MRQDRRKAGRQGIGAGLGLRHFCVLLVRFGRTRAVGGAHAFASSACVSSPPIPPSGEDTGCVPPSVSAFSLGEDTENAMRGQAEATRHRWHRLRELLRYSSLTITPLRSASRSSCQNSDFRILGKPRSPLSTRYALVCAVVDVLQNSPRSVWLIPEPWRQCQ